MSSVKSETQSEGLQGKRRSPRSPLAIYRFSVGYSQEGLAKAAGLSRETISKIENGRTKPTYATARAIASVLGPDVEFLLEGRGRG